MRITPDGSSSFCSLDVANESPELLELAELDEASPALAAVADLVAALVVTPAAAVDFIVLRLLARVTLLEEVVDGESSSS